MDWNAAIEKNREALKRVLAMLVAMAGLVGGAAFTSPLRGGRRSSDRRVGVIAAPQPPPDASRRPPLKGEVKLTLPRHLHRAILRLLRPAESAARRLIIVMARGLVVTLASTGPRKPRLTSTTLRNGTGTGIVMPRGFRPMASLSRTARTLALPLFDPLPRWGASPRPAANGIPRISLPGVTAPFPVTPRRPPAPDDPLDATRLALRLQALGAALDDLPRQARRFARWRARAADAARKPNAAVAQKGNGRDARRFRRVWPLRPGRPPGGRRRPAHEVHDILSVVHGLAFWALEPPDTS